MVWPIVPVGVDEVLAEDFTGGEFCDGDGGVGESSRCVLAENDLARLEMFWPLKRAQKRKFRRS